MHSVERSPEPEFFDELREGRTQWDALDGSDRQRIRAELARDFRAICAYCERSCQSASAPYGEPGAGDETIDHFRPRNRFPDLWLDWLNLVYACHRCNQAKGGNWPGYNDERINAILTAAYPSYEPVSEYVNPNANPGRRPAEEFFAFDPETGELWPSAQLDPLEWSIALRTIRDVDLNDRQLGENDQSHLWSRRMEQRALLIERINELDDVDEKVNIMLEFMLPDKPFSSFVANYVRARFPLFEQVVGRR